MDYRGKVFKKSTVNTLDEELMNAFHDLTKEMRKDYLKPEMNLYTMYNIEKVRLRAASLIEVAKRIKNLKPEKPL